MTSKRFRRLVGATAWVFLAWTAIDLTVPGLCALEQERQPRLIISCAALIQTTAPPAGQPPADPVHVDDCFCCSHCVDVKSIHAPAALSIALTDPPLHVESRVAGAAYVPYHPPRS